MDGGFLADDLGSLYGSWPERTVIGLSDGKGIRKYQVVLSDFVAPGDPYLPSGNDWKLVWNDEFAAPGIDWKSWRHCSRGTPDWNKHMSTREDLSFVSSGNAVLKAIVNDDLASDPDEYLTGGITGQALKSFRLGRIDVRARFDMAKAFWPAIWLMPQASIRWPAGGEIDIMEHINYEYRIHQSVHSTYTESVSKQDPVSSVNTECSVDGYHVYSVEMHEGYLVFRLDDTPTFIYRKDASKNAQFPFENYPYFVILSAQLGGKWPGQPDGTGLPAAIYIDYVRVFEKQAGDASQPEDPVVIPPSSTEGSSTIEPLEEITY